jgi:hypothetical protein
MINKRRQKLDVLFAFKAIALSDELSGTEKRVAAAIIDSFNHQTTQCDPSLNRIAHLLNMSRRTVIRAVRHLEHRRFTGKYRHGGHSHRNSYEPNWVRFREIEAIWSAHKKTRHWKSAAPDVSPYQPQTCRLAGDAAGTQTFIINQSNKHTLTGKVRETPAEDNQRTIPTTKTNNQTQLNFHSTRSTIRSQDAARAAAERRWLTELHSAYSGAPDIYAKVVDAVDRVMQEAATEAELQKHGAGFRYIVDQLKSIQENSSGNEK